MFVSKYLLNRQKIFNTWQIHKAIETYFPENNRKAGIDYVYRLEWYKIGVVVPIIVFSKTRPSADILKECQLFEVEERNLSPIEEGKEVEFSIFLVPSFSNQFDPESDFKKTRKWFDNELKGAAKIVDLKHGPDNCLYYDIEDQSFTQQTTTLKGKMVVMNHEKLELVCSSCIGSFPELGCGLLHLT